MLDYEPIDEDRYYAYQIIMEFFIAEPEAVFSPNQPETITICEYLVREGFLRDKIKDSKIVYIINE